MCRSARSRTGTIRRLVIRIDLVAHCGDNAAGSFAHTLTLTDIASGWTESVALLVREGAVVVEGVDRIRRELPFAIGGLDSDNGPP